MLTRFGRNESTDRSVMSDMNSNSSQSRELVLAGGCFWCHDAIFRQTKGVITSETGYIGGTTDSPTYRDVCSGSTGHAEAVRVVFDENIIDAQTILDIFFTTHDPTSLNRQGYDVGTQYRSALFPGASTSEEDHQDFLAALTRHQQVWDAPLVTTIEDGGFWYPAEPEHQNFYAQHPDVGYCQAIINPKLAKFRKHYAKWLS